MESLAAGLANRSAPKIRTPRTTATVPVSVLFPGFHFLVIAGLPLVGLDCDSPDYVSLGKPGVYNDLEIIPRARLHRALLESTRRFQPHVGMISFNTDALPGNNKDVFLRTEIEIECGGKVGQQPRVRSLNGKSCGKRPHDFRKLSRMAKRGEIFERHCKGHAWIRIQMHPRLLA